MENNLNKKEISEEATLLFEKLIDSLKQEGEIDIQDYMSVFSSAERAIGVENFKLIFTDVIALYLPYLGKDDVQRVILKSLTYEKWLVNKKRAFVILEIINDLLKLSKIKKIITDKGTPYEKSRAVSAKNFHDFSIFAAKEIGSDNLKKIFDQLKGLHFAEYSYPKDKDLQDRMYKAMKDEKNEWQNIFSEKYDGENDELKSKFRDIYLNESYTFSIKSNSFWEDEIQAYIEETGDDPNFYALYFIHNFIEKFGEDVFLERYHELVLEKPYFRYMLTTIHQHSPSFIIDNANQTIKENEESKRIDKENEESKRIELDHIEKKIRKEYVIERGQLMPFVAIIFFVLGHSFWGIGWKDNVFSLAFYCFGIAAVIMVIYQLINVNRK